MVTWTPAPFPSVGLPELQPPSLSASLSKGPFLLASSLGGINLNFNPKKETVFLMTKGSNRQGKNKKNLPSELENTSYPEHF